MDLVLNSLFIDAKCTCFKRIFEGPASYRVDNARVSTSPIPNMIRIQGSLIWTETDTYMPGIDHSLPQGWPVETRDRHPYSIFRLFGSETYSRPVFERVTHHSKSIDVTVHSSFVSW